MVVYFNEGIRVIMWYICFLWYVEVCRLYGVLPLSIYHEQRMMQHNFRTRLEPNLFSGHFDKAGTVLANRYAHSSCARMTRAAKTGYTTTLTSVTSPNSWTTYRAYSTGF